MLNGTGRDGMGELIIWLEANGFFESPASTRNHGCYRGGLAEHSCSVYNLLATYNARLELGATSEAVILAGLLHDVWMVGRYIGDSKPYKYNCQVQASSSANPELYDHATLSIERIQKFIKLTDLEDKMIRYHMGVYGVEDHEQGIGEYSILQMLKVWKRFPIVKVMNICDVLATLKNKAGAAVIERQRR